MPTELRLRSSGVKMSFRVSGSFFFFHFFIIVKYIFTLSMLCKISADNILTLKMPITAASDDKLPSMFYYFSDKTSFDMSSLFSLKIIINKNSAEGVVAPAGAKVRGATIRTWLLKKFISFLAVLSWKTGLKKM